jgi:hypothetical protein
LSFTCSCNKKRKKETEAGFLKLWEESQSKHEVPGREKLCPGEILTGKILSRPAGSTGAKRRKFLRDFAYNWSLCVGKIQQPLSWPGKILSQSLKRPEKYCPKTWDRIFPTGVFPGRSFSLPAGIRVPNSGK